MPKSAIKARKACVRVEIVCSARLSIAPLGCSSGLRLHWGGVAGYDTFYQTHRQRSRLLWVGANDGMLHAWNAETGREVMVYVPRVFAKRLDGNSGRPSGRYKVNATMEGHSYRIAARDIEDPKVRILCDRCLSIKQPCTAGEPGCRCAGGSCTLEVGKCKPGQRTLSAVGRSTEAAIC